MARKNDISIVVRVKPSKKQQHMRGSFRIKQTDYGIRPYSKAFGAVSVADELRIFGEIWLGAAEAKQ